MSNSKSNEFYDAINKIKQGKTPGQLLVIAVYLTSRGNKQKREIMVDIADSISELRESNKKEWLARENQGPAEIEAPTTTTSADGGKVS